MSKEEKQKKWILQAHLISALRRLFVKSPMFKFTRKNAQKEYKEKKKDGTISKARRVKYQCAICKQYFHDRKIKVKTEDNKGRVKYKEYHEISVDHVEPFIPIQGLPKLPSGKTDWNTLIERMMLGVEIWNPDDTYERIKDKSRILCYKCHEKITLEQNKERKESRDKQKGKVKNTKGKEK